MQFLGIDNVTNNELGAIQAELSRMQCSISPKNVQSKFRFYEAIF